jgi:hypothetical protein
MLNQNTVRIGELEIPADYWSLNENNKRELCLTIIDAILTILDKQVSPEISRTMILDGLLESSIQTNIEEENYEICQVLTDIKSILDEPTD